MRVATTEQQFKEIGLKPPSARWARRAAGFAHPRDVLQDPDLSCEEKRALLWSWTLDASAVKDEPSWRWLLGTPAPVPLAEVREALEQLDRRTNGSASDNRHE